MLHWQLFVSGEVHFDSGEEGIAFLIPFTSHYKTCHVNLQLLLIWREIPKIPDDFLDPADKLGILQKVTVPCWVKGMLTVDPRFAYVSW